MTSTTRRFPICIAISLVLTLTACGADDRAVPDEWHDLVRTEGQHYPIPRAWLKTEEGRIAHSLKLPESVPKPVPFDFEKADGFWFWPKSDREVAVAYFKHLCDTEAGEFISQTVDDVEGLYFARPRDQPSDDFLGDLYGPEAPWIERNFQLMGESADRRGMQFVNPPFVNYKFVEEPKRNVKWQRDIEEPYIRIYGYTFEKLKDPTYFGKRNLENLWFHLREKDPMKAIGIDSPSANYAYSWRGITRPRDRLFGIAGNELIVYERHSQKVLAVTRIFQITGRNKRRNFSASWMVAPSCGWEAGKLDVLPFPGFVTRVLHDPIITDPDLSWTRRNGNPANRPAL